MQLNLQSLYILLVLAIKPSHGYEIMKMTSQYSGGTVRFGPGTLYGAIKRMLEASLIKEVDMPNIISAKERRYYTLTNKGRKLLDSSLEQLQTTIKLAKQEHILSFAP